MFPVAPPPPRPRGPWSLSEEADPEGRACTLTHTVMLQVRCAGPLTSPKTRIFWQCPQHAEAPRPGTKPSHSRILTTWPLGAPTAHQRCKGALWSGN